MTREKKTQNELSVFFFALGLRLFGESYSGLEYDYKGLCNVYEFLDDTDNYLRYSQILETWRMIRERNLEVNIECDSLSLCTLYCEWCDLISLTKFTIFFSYLHRCRHRIMNQKTKLHWIKCVKSFSICAVKSQ